MASSTPAGGRGRGKRTVVVVGAGLCGATAALTLREEGFDGRVVVVGAEPEPPYERPPLSKEYLRGEKRFEKLLVRPQEELAERGIELLLGVAATRIDTERRTVELAEGKPLSYGAVLVATGGRNRRPRIPGLDLDGVHDLRTVGDADRLREAAGRAGRAVVVGMGFIGCEVAATLRGLGLEVTAIEAEPAPLGRVLGDAVGAAIAALHRDNGVELVLGDGVQAFEGAGRLERVRTAGGRIVPSELAVVGLGIEPATEVVEATGVVVDDGIVVDDRCRTGVEGVFAAGDVANHDHPLFGRVRVEHWQHAIEHGQAAARSILGRGEPYASVHWFWSDQYDANIQYAGHHRRADEPVIRGSLDEREFAAFYLEDGAIRAVAALGRPRDVRRAQALIRAGVRVDPTALRDPDVDLRTLLPDGSG